MPLTVTGLEEARDALRGLRDRSADPTPVLADVADEFREINRERFRTRRGWEPLSPEYAARKAQRGKGRAAGRYADNLFRSMTQQQSRHHVERISPDAVVVATRAPHAHLYDVGRKGQPARDINRVRPADARRLRLMVARYIVTGERG